jgi:D-alanine-D-alanine ligase
MKALLAAAGLPVGPHAVITPRAWATDKAAVRETVASLGYPVFVKPCRAGSSVGITKVHKPEDLDDAIEHARGHETEQPLAERESGPASRAAARFRRPRLQA